jgi:secretion/DNA translocation related TadE-like protein
VTGRDHDRGEQGSVTVVGISMLGLLLVATAVYAGIGGVVVAHRQAQSAADLGSLAAATAIQRGLAACPSASEVARRNSARLVSCHVRGEVVTVQVEVTTGRILGSARRTRASARAGPVWAGGVAP